MLVENIKKRCDGHAGRPSSLKELAIRCGFGENSIYKWNKVAPSYDRLLIVAKELKTTAEKLTKEGK